MTLEEKIKYLKGNVKPISDKIYGNGYRASAYLTDGTYLPCVKFENPKYKAELALKRFSQERKKKSIFVPNSGNEYEEIVEHFVTTGNYINEYEIERIEQSPFAFPNEILSQIYGETTMAWTGFCLKMNDNKVFAFGTSYFFDFFNMPKGYNSDDIAEVINHSYITKKGELKNHKVPFFEEPEGYDRNSIFREKPFFICYLRGL